MSFLRKSEQELSKNIGIIEITIRKFVKLQNFAKKQASLNLAQKNTLFVYLLDRILKNRCHIWNQHPQIHHTATFCEKIKMPKFWIKNSLFGFFWDKILRNYCHIWNKHPQICQIVEFSKKTKTSKSATNNPLFCFFLG